MEQIKFQNTNIQNQTQINNFKIKYYNSVKRVKKSKVGTWVFYPKIMRNEKMIEDFLQNLFYLISVLDFSRFVLDFSRFVLDFSRFVLNYSRIVLDCPGLFPDYSRCYFTLYSTSITLENGRLFRLSPRLLRLTSGVYHISLLSSHYLTLQFRQFRVRSGLTGCPRIIISILY